LRVFGTVEEMGVHAKPNVRRGVAHLSRDVDDVQPFGDEQARLGVPEGVPADVRKP
jgi:hypothetical protein